MCREGKDEKKVVKKVKKEPAPLLTHDIIKEYQLATRRELVEVVSRMKEIRPGPFEERCFTEEGKLDLKLKEWIDVVKECCPLNYQQGTTCSVPPSISGKTHITKIEIIYET